MSQDIDKSARIVDSTVGQSEIREYVTIHDSEIGDGCKVYECSSVKKSHVSSDVDINAGTYVENAEIGPNVQIGPNCSVVGVTHELSERGMTFRDDIFDRIILHERVFLGANAVVGPGVEIGERTVVAAGAAVTRDVGPEKIVLGTPPAQKIMDLKEWLNR
jgi:acetyltransferase-like isoleucine patch superfamily enzyme